MVRFHSPLPIESEPTKSRLSFCLQIPLHHGTLRIAPSLRFTMAQGKKRQKPLSVSVFMKKRRTPSFFTSLCHSTKSSFRFRTAHLERHIFIIAKSVQSVKTVKGDQSDPTAFCVLTVGLVGCFTLPPCRRCRRSRFSAGYPAPPVPMPS